MSKKLFVFGIGGTGSRVIKSLTMLLASGMKPGDFDEVIPLLIDPHKELPEFKNCNSLVSLYSSIHSNLYSDKSEIKDGFFRTSMHSLTNASSETEETIKSDISFDESSSEVFSKFIGLSEIEDNHPITADFLSLLFSDKNYNQPLSKGFKGNPHMGSIALNAIIGGPAYNTFISAFDPNDRIFIISSMFGGTGAAGFPLLLHSFRDKDEMKKQAIRDCKIGSLSVMPYFKLEDPGQTSDIDSNDFMTKTKSALTYYTRDKFKELYNAIYYIADPDGQTTAYKNDENKQENKAHIVELLGALSVFHFAQENSFKKGNIQEYCLSEDKQKVSFKTIGDTSKKIVAINLTALHLLSKLHPATKAKARSLPYCKANGFNIDFFNSDFFTENETGLEMFFDNYFIPWLSELDANQRGFSPFNLKVNSNFNYLVNGYNTEDNVLDGIFRQPVDMSHLHLKMAELTSESSIKKIDDNNNNCRYIQMCWKASNDFISSKIKIEK